MADIRAQTFNRDAQQSGDFVEFMGLAGLGQAEVSVLTRPYVDLDAGQIFPYRQKTRTGFAEPIFPQLRPLMEKLCAGKKPHEGLFSINESRKALAEACKRPGFLRELPDGRMAAQFTHRSLRRMFNTRALERGIDAQIISRWQGHRDGGVLIMRTYAHVSAVYSQRMAQLMSDSLPDNVVPMQMARR